MSILQKDKERLWKYSRTKGDQEPWKLNVIIDLRVLNWRRKNAVKDINESNGKLEYR